MGKSPLTLTANEAAVYRDSDFTTRTALLNGILEEHPKATLRGDELYLRGEIQSMNLVTDRSITLSFASSCLTSSFALHAGRLQCLYQRHFEQ